MKRQRRRIVVAATFTFASPSSAPPLDVTVCIAFQFVVPKVGDNGVKSRPSPLGGKGLTRSSLWRPHQVFEEFFSPVTAFSVVLANTAEHEFVQVDLRGDPVAKRALHFAPGQSNCV